MGAVEGWHDNAGTRASRLGALPMLRQLPGSAQQRPEGLCRSHLVTVFSSQSDCVLLLE
jgi:hypothetical protein